jgi:hypothetical protein
LYFLSGLVAIVIVVIPIAIVVPAAAVFIPPAMPLSPAAFARLTQFKASAVRLPAVPAVMLPGYVQFVIGFVDAALALIVTFGGCPRCTRECQHPEQCGRGQHHSTEKLLPSRLYGHSYSILHFLPSWDEHWGPKLWNTAPGKM